jgi:hypothetical protein
MEVIVVSESGIREMKWQEWSVMSVEGFEMMNGTARFLDFGVEFTHGCGRDC